MTLLKRALVVGLCWSISDRWPTRWSYLQMLLPKISLVIGSWSSVFCNQRSLVLRLCRWSLVSNCPKKTDDQCWFRQYHLNFCRWPSVGTNESVISHILLKTTSLLLYSAQYFIICRVLTPTKNKSIKFGLWLITSCFRGVVIPTEPLTLELLELGNV